MKKGWHQIVFYERKTKSKRKCGKCGKCGKKQKIDIIKNINMFYLI
jgi:hypothetical protein